MAQVVFFKSDNTGCGYYRSEIPAKILTEAGISAEVRFVKPTFRAYPETKVVVVQRHYIFIDVPSLLKKFKHRGIKIIYDLDDDFFNLTPETNLFRVKENLLKEMRLLASYADVMTVSTERLAFLSKNIYSGQINVIPNMLDLTLWRKSVSFPDQKVRIGWAGSPTHHTDLIQLLPVLEKVLSERPHVNLVFFGYCPKEFEKFGSRLSFIKGGSYDYYVNTFPALGIDIGIIPIVSSEFNRSKSVVKFAEFCALGLPSVVSGIEPYLGVVRDGVDGCVVLSEEQWYQKLLHLIDNLEVRKYIAENAHKRSLEFALHQNKDSWLSLINNLLITQ